MGKGLIPISAAKALSEKYKAPLVVVFSIHPDRENFTMTTYGETKKLCKLAAAYGEQFAAAVWQAAVEIQKEPAHLPEEPAMWTRGERLKGVRGCAESAATDPRVVRKMPEADRNRIMSEAAAKVAEDYAPGGKLEDVWPEDGAEGYSRP